MFCTDSQMQNMFGKVDACANNLIQPGNCAFLASSNIDGVISFSQEVNFEGTKSEKFFIFFFINCALDQII